MILQSWRLGIRRSGYYEILFVGDDSDEDLNTSLQDENAPILYLHLFQLNFKSTIDLG